MDARRLPLHETHAREGAVFETSLGWERPAWYDGGLGGTEALAREYAAARETAGLVDLSDRGLVVCSGPAREKFLHSILSNVIEGLAPGQGCSAAFMNSKGHLLALLRVLGTTDALLLETPPDREELVEQTLARYRVAAPVRFARPGLAAFGLVGPGAGDVLRGAGASVPDLALDAFVATELAGVPVRIVRSSDLPAAGFLLHVAVGDAAAAWSGLRRSSAGLTLLGRRALDALRVEEGQPWYGPDIDDENLLHETGLIARYHAPGKGCYVGQEVVARLEARGGHVNKQIRGLRLTRLAHGGAPVTAEGREVGRVTTAAVSPRSGPVALALVHRSRFEPGATVEVEGAPASVVRLPFPASPESVAAG